GEIGVDVANLDLDAGQYGAARVDDGTVYDRGRDLGLGRHTRHGRQPDDHRRKHMQEPHDTTSFARNIGFETAGRSVPASTRRRREGDTTGPNARTNGPRCAVLKSRPGD